MAMEERKCQISWSSKNESRMQSLLCSRDSAGVFCVGGGKRKQQRVRVGDIQRGRHFLCVRESSHLPSAETLEEEVEREAPHHGREENTHQRQTLDPLTAPQLSTHTKCCLLIPPKHLLIIHTVIDTTTHLHNDVKGKVEQQVADGDGQQVGGEVIWSLYEAVGSSAEREQQGDVIILAHLN